MKAIIALFFFYIPILSMEKESTWDIILRHGMQWFNYAMIRSLAVNKQFDTLLKQTAKIRKHYFLQDCSLKDNDKDNDTYIQWHKYGTAYAKVWIEPDFNYPVVVGNWLMLERHYVGDKTTQVKWDGFQGFLPDIQKGFFDQEGNFSLYGYGELPGSYCGYFTRVRQYTLLVDNCCKTQECITNIVQYDRFINLQIFLEFPVLLKAFLNSSKVITIESKISNDSDSQLFCLQGVIIPKNYKEHKQYFSRKIYESFDDLPKEVRKPIIALYKKQNKKDKERHIPLLEWSKK